MQTAVIIPARFGSQRLPGKPLKTLAHLPLIVHVFRQASLCKGADIVVIATDSEEIAEAARHHGARAIMTSPDHPSGTDRVAEVARQLDAEWIINVQGDEPFIDPHDIQTVIDALKTNQTDPVTLCYPLQDVQELQDPGVVKVVCREDGAALYFSRAPSPFPRDPQSSLNHSFRHLGIYGYRKATLQALTTMPPHPLEEVEKLEQLRALAHGMTIGVHQARSLSHGIDTPEDLKWAQQQIAQMGSAAFPSGRIQ